MNRWFLRSQEVLRSYRVLDDGTLLVTRSFLLKVPSQGSDTPWEVRLPVYMYSAAELASVTNTEGEIFLDKLPEFEFSDVRVLKPSEESRLKQNFDTLPICYPPYRIICPGIADEPPATQRAVQEFVEQAYEAIAPN